MRESEPDSTKRMPIQEASASLERMFGGDVVVVDAFAHCDTRGRLIEFDQRALPFEVRRVFTIGEVPAGTVRGGHRHRKGSQALFCIAGRVDVGLRRGTTTHDFVTLTPGSPGICISGGVWSEQLYVAEGSSLLAMASDPYDPDSYDSEHMT